MIVLVAPAKLTLRLRIVGTRGDGYHAIDAEMASLDLADDITVEEGDGLEIIGVDGIDTGAGNLVNRALAVLGRKAQVTVDKRIPPGAGLGGGSTDAAAVLRWGGVDDTDTAAAIGADVAFCLIGGRARVGGMGEVVDPLPYEHRSFTLLIPPIGCPTAAVYQRWDELGGPEGDHGNDLEPAALSLMPGLARYRDTLGDATGARPRLAGSGSTWFVDGEFPDAGLVTRTVAAGWTG